MLQKNRSVAVTVSTTMIIIAIVLFIGILSIVYSQLQHDSHVLYLGLIITLAGVMCGIFRMVIQGKT